MSLDGVMLHNIKAEIVSSAAGARIDKIMQPSRDEIILHLRTNSGKKSIVINLVAGNARIHFTENIPDNPQKPPMFCMLLRKHLGSARLDSIEQYGLDRVVKLVFEGYNELGDRSKFGLIIEIMGKYSNLILTDNDDRIIDAIKKIDFSSAGSRQILPGLKYIYPEKQGKLNILTDSTTDIMAAVTESGDYLSKALLGALEGFSPLPVNEIASRVTGGNDHPADALSSQEKEKLDRELTRLKLDLENNISWPVMVLENDDRPKDFTFIKINMFGDILKTREFECYSQLLDFFYVNRDKSERIRQRSGNLLKLLKNTLSRIQRRIANQMQELEEAKDKENYKVKGDILTANLYRIEKNQKNVTLENLYDNNNSTTIELDSRKSPSQNAQRYYALYRKLDTAEKVLATQIKQGRQEEQYVESVLDLLLRSETETDLEEIRQELIETGYVKKSSKSPKITIKSKPYQFKSEDGYTILVGRNNKQNDQLTLKQSQKDDIWLHVKDIPGSHVIIKTNSTTLPETTIEQAATIAAYYSKAGEASKVQVDYTPVKFVKKASGAKPGMVFYNEFKTIIVDPSREFVERLKAE